MYEIQSNTSLLFTDWGDKDLISYSASHKYNSQLTVLSVFVLFLLRFTSFPNLGCGNHHWGRALQKGTAGPECRLDLQHGDRNFDLHKM